MKKKTNSFRSSVEEEYQLFDEGRELHYDIKYYGDFAVVLHEVLPVKQEIWFDFHHPQWMKKHIYISTGYNYSSERPLQALWYEKAAGNHTSLKKYIDELDLDSFYKQLLASPIDWTEYLFSDCAPARSFAARMLNEK